MSPGDADLRPLTIAGGRYAVLLHVGPYAELHRAYTWLYREWLPTSGEEPSDRSMRGGVPEQPARRAAVRAAHRDLAAAADDSGVVSQSTREVGEAAMGCTADRSLARAPCHLRRRRTSCARPRPEAVAPALRVAAGAAARRVAAAGIRAGASTSRQNCASLSSVMRWPFSRSRLISISFRPPSRPAACSGVGPAAHDHGGLRPTARRGRSRRRGVAARRRVARAAGSGCR